MDFQDFSNMGLNDKLMVLSIIVTIALALIPLVYRMIRTLKSAKEWREKEIRRKLEPNNSDGLKLVRDLKYFIPINGQLEAPHNTDEIFISDNRFLLTKKFINEYLNSKVTGKKRYIILGGSGMGKSTFSADLFFQYINKYNQRNIPFPINILYLGDSDVLDKIVDLSKKEDACESILILDALDENVDAIKDISSFMNKIDLITNIFKFVIITGRTQLFQDDVSEPTIGKIKQNSNLSKRLKYERIYVSPFSEYEIQTYLANKFTIGTENYRKAIQIVNKGNDLMSRPMILSFIDDLLGFARCERLTIVEIYKTIIDKWLLRECETQEDSDNRLNVNDLYIFSKRLAVYMYDKWETTGISHITKSEYEYFIESNGYSGNPYSFRGRSLINRKSDGSIKFSHKSFWEFFIALDVLENPGKSYNPDNLDMAKMFVIELNNMYLNGQILDYVYYNVPYNSTVDLTDPMLLKVFSEEQPYNESYSEVKYNQQKLFELWGIIVSKIVMIKSTCENDLMSITQNIKDSLKNGSIYSKVEKLKSKVQDMSKSYEDFNHLIYYIQDSFSNDSSLNERISVIQDKIKRIATQMPKDELQALIGTSIKKNVLVFPNLFGCNQDVINNVLANYTPVIGRGFYSDESVYSLINNILKKRPAIPVIFVMEHSRCIEDMVTFVWNLMTQLELMETKDSLLLIVRFNIDDVSIPYVCRKKSSDNSLENIRACMTNMYESAIKKYK